MIIFMLFALISQLLFFFRFFLLKTFQFISLGIKSVGRMNFDFEINFEKLESLVHLNNGCCVSLQSSVFTLTNHEIATRECFISFLWSTVCCGSTSTDWDWFFNRHPKCYSQSVLLVYSFFYNSLLMRCSKFFFISYLFFWLSFSFSFLCFRRGEQQRISHTHTHQPSRMVVTLIIPDFVGLVLRLKGSLLFVTQKSFIFHPFSIAFNLNHFRPNRKHYLYCPLNSTATTILFYSDFTN